VGHHTPATITGGGGLNLIQIQIQTDSNQVQIVSSFDRPKKDPIELQKFEIKYGFEDLEKIKKISIETSLDSYGILNKNSEKF
jgi:hypothetical protein